MLERGRGDEWFMCMGPRPTPLDVSDVGYSAIYPPIDRKKKKKKRADKVFANRCK